MRPLRRYGSFLHGLFVLGPLFFHAAGRHETAAVGWIGALLSGAAYVSLRGERPLRAAILYALSFDVTALGYSFLLGRDSGVAIGVLVPLAIFTFLLDSATPAVRRALLAMQTLTLIPALLAPIAPSVAGVLPWQLAVLRVCSAGIGALVLLATARTWSALIAERSLESDRAARALRRVASRHAHAEAALAEAMREGDEAEQAREALVESVTHEIRTPLAMMLGLTEALRDEAAERDDAPLARDLTELLDAEARLHQMVEDLLDVGSHDASRGDPRRAIDVQELWAELEVTHGGGETNAGTRLEFEPFEGELVLDPTRLRRALTDLLEEALLLFAGGAIRLRCERLLGAAGEPLARISLRCIAASPEESPSAQDVGSGHHLTRRLVARMGGSLTVGTDPSGGYRTVIDLPEGASESPTRRRPRARSSGSTATRAPRHGAITGAHPRVPAGALDAEVLDRLQAELADPEFMQELVGWFHESAERNVRVGRAASHALDRESMQRAAHSLRGTANTIGALRLAALATELEEAEGAEVALLDARWSAAGAEVATVHAALEARALGGPTGALMPHP